MHFIGDLSVRDHAVLGRHGLAATVGILEFGVGGSTQILAQMSDPRLPFVSIDTDPAWIVKTRQNLLRLGLRRAAPVDFRHWAMGQAIPLPHDYDLVFVDGLRELRRTFANAAWANLRVGGKLLFHDCRRDLDLEDVLTFVRQHAPETEALQLSLEQSNLAAITKRKYLQAENWQTGKAMWELGVGEPPAELPWPPAC